MGTDGRTDGRTRSCSRSLMSSRKTEAKNEKRHRTRVDKIEEPSRQTTNTIKHKQPTNKTTFTNQRHMGIFGKNKTKTNNKAPYNPYDPYAASSTAPPASGFANALNPGAAPPPAVYQPSAPPAVYQPSAPPASYDNRYTAPYVPGTGATSSTMNTPAPKKYTKVNGVMKLNPVRSLVECDCLLWSKYFRLYFW